MSVSTCSSLGDLLARRDDDRLSPAEEHLLSGHLATCDACAAEALGHDPILLFARDAARSTSDVLSPEARERLVADVLASATAARAGRRLAVSRAHLGLRIAASLLLVASLAGLWFARGRDASSTRNDAVPAAVAAGPRPAQNETLPALESFSAAGAVVYQFPASTPGEPTVVFVVDRNADI